MPAAQVTRPASASRQPPWGFVPLPGASVPVSDMLAWVPPLLISCQHHFVISLPFRGDSLNFTFQSLLVSSHLCYHVFNYQELYFLNVHLRVILYLSHGFDVLSEDSFFSLSLLVNLISPFFPPICLGLSLGPQRIGPLASQILQKSPSGPAQSHCVRAIVGERRALCIQHSIWRHTAAAFVSSVGPILCFVQKACLTLSREKTSLTSAELREMQEPRSLVSLSLDFLNSSFKPPSPPQVLEGTMSQFLVFEDSLLFHVVLGFGVLRSATLTCPGPSPFHLLKCFVLAVSLLSPCFRIYVFLKEILFLYLLCFNEVLIEEQN
ncbi:uncharacterized protein LOC109489495 [Ailuropoda melanoleuca]|uniref:uncharacterized protein LOC109489495 n=1 Tax=Ailuropoda melanoleuca TaxID=9646 RepID=UPI0009481492|nr:uncharacterized protein LOC109489495 [Ailuropoda melanoleuca]